MSRQRLEQAATDQIVAGAVQHRGQRRIDVGPPEIADGAIRRAQRLEDAKAIEGKILGGAKASLARKGALIVAPCGFGGGDRHERGCSQKNHATKALRAVDRRPGPRPASSVTIKIAGKNVANGTSPGNGAPKTPLRPAASAVTQSATP